MFLMQPRQDARRSISDWMKACLDLVAQRFVLLRYPQHLSEMRRILIPIEAGLVGRDFEQDAAGCPEVNCPEIVPVDDRRDLITGVGKRFANFKLRCPILHRKRNVVDRTRALLRGPCVGLCFNVDKIGAIAILNGEADRTIMFISFLVTHELE